MLETTATRLWSEPGGPHYGSPDKEPAVRLRTLTDAGRVGVPFTTGILIGIGENRTERAESIFAIRAAARAHGHIQEMIVQNFRAKPDTAMRNDPDADLEDLAATIAVARLVLGPKMRVQAPPNLVGDQFALMLRAGIDDWGGVSPVTADHVNPERPWPAIDELAARSAAAGFTLRERLTAYPKYVLAGSPWIDTRLLGHVAALADPATGLAHEDAPVVGRPWQEPDGGFASTGRIDLNTAIDTDRAHRGPARRLRRGLRRLGRAAGRAGRDPQVASRSGWTPTCGPGWRSPSPTRRRCSTRRTAPPRWPCSRPTGRRWTS